MATPPPSPTTNVDLLLPFSMKHKGHLTLSCESNGLRADFQPLLGKPKGKFSIFFPIATYLDYSRNNFSSSIPNEIEDFLNKTLFFSLSSNNLHGPIPISICNATVLRLLDLSNNSLSGMIPKCLIAGSLGALNLRRNNFTGNLSNSIFTEDCLLESLDLSGNQIECQLPKSLIHCTGLQTLNLINNHITDSFPCFLKNLSTLRVLVLQSNKFYEHIGCSEANETWPTLQIIEVAANNFNGEIPATYLTTWQTMMDRKDGVSVLGFTQVHGAYPSVSIQNAVTVTSKGLKINLLKIISIFTLIDFSCNNFSGQVPKEIGDFESLYVLNLFKNVFTGESSLSLGNIRNLEFLDLSHNKLSRKIPPQLANLSFLSFMNLSNNQLVRRKTNWHSILNIFKYLLYW
ncbi:receptor-like protein 33 [Pyrus x bretschneideri]|uniref:receptor-like protein 33 n=1 Tax=Pyrus x bretschneideri TaxID=225117 RepID=UPI00202EC8B1|nr:receptor-like protein 33 [Pyrus x bretschneideri]